MKWQGTATLAEWTDMGREPWLGWRRPIVYITRVLLEDMPQIVRENRWHVFVHYEFDRDISVYAWWPIAPLVTLVFWWRARRYCVERVLAGRVLDVREGDLLSNWRLRPLRRWSIQRTWGVNTRFSHG